jgi:hypothetical protein
MIIAPMKPKPIADMRRQWIGQAGEKEQGSEGDQRAAGGVQPQRRRKPGAARFQQQRRH